MDTTEVKKKEDMLLVMNRLIYITMGDGQMVARLWQNVR